MHADTIIFCPDHIRGSANPWRGTLEELAASNPDRVGNLIAELESRGALEPLPEDADEERWIADIAHLLTLDDVRTLADDPNTVINPMTDAELRVAREHLGLTGEAVSKLLDVQDRTVRRWEAGTSPIPDGVTDAMEQWEQVTTEHVAALVNATAGMRTPTVKTYRNDTDFWADQPEMQPFPASWHRAVTTRVAQQIPTLRITFN